jgi:hypothetical protein
MDIRLFFFVLCVGSRLRDELFPSSEQSYPVRLCLFLCVVYVPQQRVTLALSFTAAPQNEGNVNLLTDTRN